MNRNTNWKGVARIGDLIENVFKSEDLPRSARGRVIGVGNGSMTADFGTYGTFRICGRHLEKLEGKK